MLDAQVLWVSSDAVSLFEDGAVRTITGLEPETTVSGNGWSATTFARPGERLSTIATVNDVHFGETHCGLIAGTTLAPVLSVPEGSEPYPAMMSRCAIAEINAADPDLVVVKGDLTDSGRPEEFAAFFDAYGGAFGDKLVFVRGNHDGDPGEKHAAIPFQERAVDGAIVALLDTSVRGFANGTLSTEQLDALDELGQRADRPVLVMGHHPLFDPRTEIRNDDAFGLRPGASDALLEIFRRRPRLVGYLAGHTHRNKVAYHDGVPFIEVGATKDFPGNWGEYQVFDGGILAVVHRVAAPEAVAWTEQTKVIYNGTYEAHAFGSVEERSFLIPIR